jgi:hypothetical protein
MHLEGKAGKPQNPTALPTRPWDKTLPKVAICNVCSIRSLVQPLLTGIDICWLSEILHVSQVAWYAQALQASLISIVDKQAQPVCVWQDY